MLIVIWGGVALQSILLAAILFASARMVRTLSRLTFAKLLDGPTPPTNIRLILSNGELLTVDSELSPVKTWVIRLPPSIDPTDVVSMKVDVIPPLTEIKLVRHAEKGD